MPVDTPHAEWTDLCLVWKTIRDVIGGSRFVKGAGDSYLEVLREQDPRAYERYKNRAVYFNGTARTVEGLHGLVLRKPPIIKCPDTPVFERIREDFTMDGTTIENYGGDILRETISVGRAGTLVDYNLNELRPFAARYDAEMILNWKVTRIKGRMVLSMLVLREFDPIWINLGDGEKEPDEFDTTRFEQWRVYRLLPDDQGNYYCECKIYRKKKSKNTKPVEGEEEEFVEVDSSIPHRRAQTLQFIPFIFHGSNNNLPPCNKPPMEDMSELNLAHYRSSADYRNGLHLSGLPTPWVAGFELKGEDDELYIGSTSAWVSENADAKCGYLEVESEFNALRQDLQDLKADMALLGARLLEPQKAQTEAAETHKIRQAGESATLLNISQSVSASMTTVLQMMQWWMDTVADPSNVSEDQVSVEFNEDFIDSSIDGPTLQALIAGWMNRAYSYESLFDKLQDGEIIPPERTLEEEQEKIKSDIVMPLPVSQAPPPDKTGSTNDPEGKGDPNKSGSGAGTGTDNKTSQNTPPGKSLGEATSEP